MDVSGLSPGRYGEIFAANRDKFISIACSYVRERHIAEDIVDESFAKFWGSRDKISINLSVEAYILKMVKNRCLNYLRDKMGKLRMQDEINSDEHKFLIFETDFLATEDLSFLFHTEVEDIFKKVIDSLPKQSRNIFMSSRFLDMTYKEIAIKEGISERMVKRSIQKTLALLRVALKDYLILFPIIISLLLPKS